MIRVKEIRRWRPNLFMSDEEARIILEYSKLWSSKFQLILALAFFRGLRVGEIVAVNVNDFEENFSRIRVIFEKTHVMDSIPLIPELSERVKDYIVKNHWTFKDGYLFPYYISRRKVPHMSVGVAEALFSKLRKIIGQDHPGFLEHTVIGNGQRRYRIGFHSCRRWFETRLQDFVKDRNTTANIMRYFDSSTVDVYVDPYELWKKEREILEQAFKDKIKLLG